MLYFAFPLTDTRHLNTNKVKFLFVFCYGKKKKFSKQSADNTPKTQRILEISANILLNWHKNSDPWHYDTFSERYWTTPEILPAVSKKKSHFNDFLECE